MKKHGQSRAEVTPTWKGSDDVLEIVVAGRGGRVLKAD